MIEGFSNSRHLHSHSEWGMEDLQTDKQFTGWTHMYTHCSWPGGTVRYVMVTVARLCVYASVFIMTCEAHHSESNKLWSVCSFLLTGYEVLNTLIPTVFLLFPVTLCFSIISEKQTNKHLIGAKPFWKERALSTVRNVQLLTKTDGTPVSRSFSVLAVFTFLARYNVTMNRIQKRLWGNYQTLFPTYLRDLFRFDTSGETHPTNRCTVKQHVDLLCKEYSNFWT